MKIIKSLALAAALLLVLLMPRLCRAMPPGTLLYRTSGAGKMYGYSGDPLIYEEKGILKDIYAGHVGIYVGREDGEDYVVEAMANGIVKTPAKYFVNRANGETFLGAKIPVAASPLQLAKAVSLAKSLAAASPAYDFDFHVQKGPADGEWTCVGLAEKIYESANIINPDDLAGLEYNPADYAVDITPDGFDNYSTVDQGGNCFSRDREFSKIARRKDLIIPAPEIIGFNVGLEKSGERYIFLPYTQFLQPALRSVAADITIASSFSDSIARAPFNARTLVLRWSLINNPVSAMKNIASLTKEALVSAVTRVAAVAKNIGAKIIGSDSGTEIVLNGEKAIAAAKEKTATKKKTAVSKVPTPAKESVVFPKVVINKAIVGKAVSAAKKAPVTAVKAATLVSAATEMSASQLIASAVTDRAAETVRKTALKINKASAALGGSSVSSSAASQVSAASSPTPASAGSLSSSSSTSSSSSSSSASSSSSSASSPSSSPAPVPLARIDKIYATGNNDFVELFNPTNSDFDLAAAHYRLEKARTAEDPSLIMRLGNNEDGTYPGGTIIKAHSKYLIVRAGANAYHLALADAVASRDDFNWSGSGYTIYLGVDAISSSTDGDIVDAIGFGPEAIYFRGASPAPLVADNYVLSRVAANGNNGTDFNLLPSSDPEALAAIAAVNSVTATSTDAIATSTGAVATSTDAVIATSTEVVATSTAPLVEAGVEHRALINKIYATESNDFIELSNPTDVDFDLATAGFRLEKTRTAEDPSLMMRIGNSEDGAYPGGTIIKAHDKYLIVRAGANSYHLTRADAIASRDEFSWSGSGYSVYLGRGPISSSTDEDIVDAVGFGTDAAYFLGAGPASEITDGHILSRTADTKNNAADFSLISSADPAIIVAEIPVEENVPPGESTSGLADLFIPPVPKDSDGISGLWHFNECYGVGKWAVGKWDCAREVGFVYDKVDLPLSPVADLANFSLSFYYKKSLVTQRLDARLSDGDNVKARLILEPGMITVEGLPETDWRYYIDPPFDSNWHQATLVINKAEDYWGVYIDGQPVIRQTFVSRMPVVNKLEFGGDCGSVLVDEIATWSRALEETEIAANYSMDVPFAPLTARNPQQAATLSHQWNFSEDIGATAADSIGSATLGVLDSSWTYRAHDNYALKTLFDQTFSAAFATPLVSRDLSLAFWWRNVSYPNEGRANITLLGEGENKLFSLMANHYRPAYWFNGSYAAWSEGENKTIPYDDKWHHLAMVYDSYRYRLRFYVDGEEKASSSLIWMPDDSVISGLKITNDNYSAAIDDLSVWKGALSSAEIKEIYTNNK